MPSRCTRDGRAQDGRRLSLAAGAVRVIEATAAVRLTQQTCLRLPVVGDVIAGVVNLTGDCPIAL